MNAVNTLDAQLDVITLSLAGKKLAAPLVITKDHLPESVHAEYDAVTALLGNELYSLYNGRDGISLNRPKLCLSLEGKAVIATLGGICPAPLKQVTATSQGTALELEVGEEFYSVKLQSAFVPKFEGVASAATLSKDASSVLVPSGFSGVKAKGKFKGIKQTVFKAGTDDEYTQTVIGVGDHQILLYNVDASMVKTLSELKGEASFVDGVFTSGPVTFTTRGATNVKDLNPGFYPITAHRWAVFKTKEGKSFDKLIVTTPNGEVSLPSDLAKSVSAYSDGSNMEIIVPEVDSKSRPSVRLTSTSSTLLDKFVDAFVLA